MRQPLKQWCMKEKSALRRFASRKWNLFLSRVQTLTALSHICATSVTFTLRRTTVVIGHKHRTGNQFKVITASLIACNVHQILLE